MGGKPSPTVAVRQASNRPATADSSSALLSETEFVPVHRRPLERLRALNTPKRRRDALEWTRWSFAGLLERLISCIIVLGVVIGISIKLSYTPAPDTLDREALAFDFTTNVTAIPDIEVYDPDRPYNFLLETHAHTTASDGQMSPEQLVEWFHAYGFDGFVLSDHNTLAGVKRAQKAAQKYNMTVIPAIEYSCCRIHMNFVNVTTTDGLEAVTWPSDDELRRLIDLVHSRGGKVVVNHLPWSDQTQYGWELPTLPDRPSIDDLLSWGADAFESVHDNTIDLRMLRLTQNRTLPIIASNDIHGVSEAPYVWNALNVTNRTVDGVLDALFSSKGSSTFLYSATGPIERAYFPERNTFFGYNAWVPLRSLSFDWLFDESKGMYSFTGEFCQPRQFAFHGARIFWFVLYVLCFFLAYELARALIRSAWRGVMHWFATRRQRQLQA